MEKALSTLQYGKKPLEKLSLFTGVRVLIWGGGEVRGGRVGGDAFKG